MRLLPLLAFVWCASAAAASAQEQEAKLMDRLLKPDMTLQNSAQNKAFVVGGSAPTKRAPSKTFQFADRTTVKSYTGERAFTTDEFKTHASPDQNRDSRQSRQSAPEAQGRYATPSYAGVRPASDAQKTAGVSEFTESTRAFLVRGKSQAPLRAQDWPLSLEQVRELLNKNK